MLSSGSRSREQGVRIKYSLVFSKKKMMSKSFIRQFLVKYQTRFNWQTLEDKSKLKLPYCFGKKWSTLKPPYGHNGKTMITLNLPRFHTVVRRTCNLFCKCTYAQLLICFNAIQKLQSSQCWNNPSLNSYEFYSSLMVRRLRFYEKGLMCGIHKKRNLPKKARKKNWYDKINDLQRRWSTRP